MLGEHKSTSYTLFKWSVLFFFSAFPPFRLKFFFIYFCRNHFIISRTRYLYNTCIFFRSYCEHFLWNLPVSQALFLSIHFILSTILYACPQCIIIIIIQNSTFYGFWPRTMTMMFFFNISTFTLSATWLFFNIFYFESHPQNDETSFHSNFALNQVILKCSITVIFFVV